MAQIDFNIRLDAKLSLTLKEPSTAPSLWRRLRAEVINAGMLIMEKAGGWCAMVLAELLAALFRNGSE